MEDMTLSGFGDILKAYRKQKKMSQQVLACRLDVHRNTIGGWEHGDFLPASKTMVLEMAKQLRLNEQETHRLLEASLTTITPYWNVPYQRNPFFTGREPLIQHLHDVLRQKQPFDFTQPYALTGLGGIGKTQAVIEYVYRFAQEYTAICWIHAETTETLLASFSAIAHLLNLAEKLEQDQKKMTAAVLQWFSRHRDWLLIFDNVEDIAVIKPFLPSGPHQGYILLTTRMQVTEPIAFSLQLEGLSLEEGALLLLRRIKRLSSDDLVTTVPLQERQSARSLSEKLSGLPLALDQAGAYILETGCLLSDYLALYEQRHDILLARRGSIFSEEHPDSVTTTFSLVFEKVEQKNAAAADLLRLCIFLAPDAIPEALIRGGATLLGPSLAVVVADPFAFDEAIKTLRSFSLIQRHPYEKTLNLHRLLQMVLRDEMSEDMQRGWINCCIRLLQQSFPEGRRIVGQWEWCEQLLPHVLLNIESTNIEEKFALEQASLAYKTAIYLFDRAQFGQAEHLFQQSLRIRECLLGLSHVDVASSLKELALLYREQGKYMDAEPFYERALSILQQTLEPDHLDIAQLLSSQAILYMFQGKYARAELLYERALSIQERALGPSHLDMVSPLNNLAILYRKQGRYVDMEPLYKRALYILEQALEPEHPDVAQTLSNLAGLYVQQGKYRQAEPLCQRALRIAEHVLGPHHPNVGLCLGNLAELCYKMEEYERVEPLYQRSLHIWEQGLGSAHPLVSNALLCLANLYRVQGKGEQAKQFYQRSLHIRERAFGLQHPDTAEVMYEFACLWDEQGNNREAESFYQCALEIQGPLLGAQHPMTIATRMAYTRFLQKLGRLEEAAALEVAM